MFTVILQDLFSACKILCFTGDTVGKYPSFFAGFFIEGDTFDHECLPNMRKVQRIIEFGGYPDVSCFNASVVWGIACSMIRISLYICEVT